MRRRTLISLVGGAAAWLLTAAIPVPAQPRASIPRVGLLSPLGSETTLGFNAFRKGLRDLGYVEGRSIILDFRLAKGHSDALPALAADLVKIPVDVIVVDGINAARAAVKVTQSIPIVQAVGGDPVAAGLAASYARPGGNFTGFSIRSDELAGKRLELLKRAFPGISRVTVLLDRTSAATPPVLRATEKAAADLNILLATLPADTPESLGALGPAHLAGSDGLVVIPSGPFWQHRATIIALAAAARLPAIYPEREYADDGGLIAYGPNIPDTYRQAAGYVDRILRGARPSDLAINAVSKLDFVLNLRTAREIGANLPIDFLFGVRDFIE
jgi:putative ABC transport system substrate-binding protein